MYSDPDGTYIDNITVSNTVDVTHDVTLEIVTEFSDETIGQGELVELLIQVRDDVRYHVEEAVVEIQVGEQVFDALEIEPGLYQINIDTSTFEGDINIIVTAEKMGYLSSTISEFLTVSLPAEFVVNNLLIEGDSVQVGDAVEISVQVSNVGGLVGAHTVVLRVNEEVEDEFEVTLDPDGSDTVLFEYSPTQAGNYTVVIGDLSGSFTVEEQTIVETPSETDTESSGGIPGYPVWSIVIALLLISLRCYGGARSSGWIRRLGFFLSREVRFP